MIFPTTADFVGAVFGAVLTLMVFSYLLGDNPAFRLSIHLFIGVSAGLASAVALRNVIIPFIVLPLLDVSDMVQWAWSLALLLLSVLMLFKLSPRFGRLGNFPMAYIVGVGAAIAASGAVAGTIFPQIKAATDLFNLGTLVAFSPMESLLGAVNRFIAVIGTVSTLAFFHFSGRSKANEPGERNALVKYLARIGEIFIAITFGILFAGVLSAALTAWVDRWQFIVEFVKTLWQAFYGS